LYVIIPFIRTKFIIIVGTETYLANDEPLPPPARRSHTHAVCLSVCLSVCELTLSVCRSHHDEGDRRRSKTYLRPALHFHRPPSARTASTRTHTHTHTHTERERERELWGALSELWLPLWAYAEFCLELSKQQSIGIRLDLRRCTHISVGIEPLMLKLSSRPLSSTPVDAKAPPGAVPAPSAAVRWYLHGFDTPPPRVSVRQRPTRYVYWQNFNAT
jgi:hypothetical protein